MKKNIFITIILIWTTTFYIQKLFSENKKDQSTCTYMQCKKKSFKNKIPVTIYSDKVQIKNVNDVIFFGNVQLKKGNIFLSSDVLWLHKNNYFQGKKISIANAIGNIYYFNDHLVIKGEKALFNFYNKDINIWNGEYRFLEHKGYGRAEYIKVYHDDDISLKNTTFNLCSNTKYSWSIDAKKIIKNKKYNNIQAWNIKFKVGSIPLFYSPHITLPISRKQNLDLLIPNVKYNKNGAEFSYPYHINIKKNIYAILTPRYMSKRGTEYQSELHYLKKNTGWGFLKFNYLKKDNLYKNNMPFSRWLLHWKHNVAYKNLHLSMQYSRLSDLYYFSDLISNFHEKFENYLVNEANISYFKKKWNVIFKIQDFNIYPKNKMYQVYPQVDFEIFKNIIKDFNIHIKIQTEKFKNLNSIFPQSKKIHFFPSIDFPIYYRWGSININLKLLEKYYHKDKIKDFNNFYISALKEKNNTIIPQLKINLESIFERKIFGKKILHQTFKPYVQYVYTHFKNQEHLYSSVLPELLTTDIFKKNNTTKFAHILSKHKISTGFTSNFYDANFSEYFNISLGCIYNFPFFSIKFDNDHQKKYLKNLVLESNLYWKINNYWTSTSNIQYINTLNRMYRSNIELEYNNQRDKVFTINYRYINDLFTEIGFENNKNKKFKSHIAQIGFIISWPIYDKWSFSSSYYYSTNIKKPVDQLFGIQYTSNCYKITLGYEKKINTMKKNFEYKNHISLNFSINGRR